VIEAHGGAERWNTLEALDADISAWGLLFTVKRRPILNHVRVRASTRVPHLALLDFPRPGQTSELIGNEEVCIFSGDEKVVARRVNPRSNFRQLRRRFYWDSLDFVYFCGYAMWNYLVTPFLFLRDGFQFELLEPVGNNNPSWLQLRATFPEGIPTHCKEQTFHFDANRLLRRLDYTADVVGGWAHAAHICENYMDFDGIKAPTRRRVRPMPWGNRPLPGPTIVALEIHNIRPIRVS
jgi:hypothetical protein